MAETEVGYAGEGSLGHPLDTKYRFVARSIEHGTEHSGHDAILFCAHDAALPRALLAYREEAVRLGASARQLAGIDRLIEDVRLWQARHPAKVRVADTGE